MQTSDLRWRFLAVVHSFVGLTAVVSGGVLVAQPSGAWVGVPLSLLDPSPFTDYLVPGLALCFGVGVTNLIAAWLIARQRPNAEVPSMLAAGALLSWITAEMAMVQMVNWLTVGALVLGLLIALDAAWIWRRPLLQPAVR